MTGDIVPCQVPVAVTASGSEHRRDPYQTRKRRPPVPAYRSAPVEPEDGQLSDELTHPPHLGTRINVRA